MWPPIMCPKCWGMKWRVLSHIACCMFCRHVIVKRKGW